MNKYNLFLVSFCGLVIVSCNKYEDGGNFSLRSKKERLSNHWEPEKVYLAEISTEPEVMGQDITFQYPNTDFIISKDGTYEFTNFGPDSTVKTVESGVWEFLSDKKQFKTSGTEISYIVSSGQAFDESQLTTQWGITKLKEDELWLWYFGNDTSPYEYFQLKPIE